MLLGLNMSILNGGKNDGNANLTNMRVSLDKIIEHMEFQSESIISYLNTTTGKIVLICDESISAADAGEDIDPLTGESLDDIRTALTGEDYIPLPDHFDIDEYRMMERFTQSVADQTISNALLMALRGSGAFRRFKDAVHNMDLAENWYKFHNGEYEEIAIGWCKEHGIEYHR